MPPKAYKTSSSSLPALIKNKNLQGKHQPPPLEIAPPSLEESVSPPPLQLQAPTSKRIAAAVLVPQLSPPTSSSSSSSSSSASPPPKSPHKPCEIEEEEEVHEAKAHKEEEEKANALPKELYMNQQALQANANDLQERIQRTIHSYGVHDLNILGTGGGPSSSPSSSAAGGRNNRFGIEYVRSGRRREFGFMASAGRDELVDDTYEDMLGEEDDLYDDAREMYSRSGRGGGRGGSRGRRMRAWFQSLFARKTTGMQRKKHAGEGKKVEEEVEEEKERTCVENFSWACPAHLVAMTMCICFTVLLSVLGMLFVAMFEEIHFIEQRLDTLEMEVDNATLTLLSINNSTSQPN